MRERHGLRPDIIEAAQTQLPVMDEEREYVLFVSGDPQALRREENRERIKSEQGLTMREVMGRGMYNNQVNFMRRQHMNKPTQEGKR